MPLGGGALACLKWTRVDGIWSDGLVRYAGFMESVIVELGRRTSQPSLPANVQPTMLTLHIDMLQSSANMLVTLYLHVR